MRILFQIMSFSGNSNEEALYLVGHAHKEPSRRKL